MPKLWYAIHMTCASMWAKSNNKESDGTVLRCPHCFYLLKVPAAVQTATKLHQEVKNEAKTAASSNQTQQVFMPKRVVASSLGDAAMYSACPVCSGIFDENETVVACGNSHCNAIYHESCFNQIANSTCKVCGAKFEFRILIFSKIISLLLLRLFKKFNFDYFSIKNLKS